MSSIENETGKCVATYERSLSMKVLRDLAIRLTDVVLWADNNRETAETSEERRYWEDYLRVVDGMHDTVADAIYERERKS